MFLGQVENQAKSILPDLWKPPGPLASSLRESATPPLSHPRAWSAKKFWPLRLQGSIEPKLTQNLEKRQNPPGPPKIYLVFRYICLGGPCNTCIQLSHPKHTFLNFLDWTNIENLKCIKTVLESGSLNRPVFAIPPVTRFGMREKPSRVDRF